MFIIEWWNSIGLAAQIFACIAIPSTLILLVQTILMFIGIGDDSDVDGIGEAEIADGGDLIADDIETDVPDGVFGDGDVDELPSDTGMDGLRLFTFRGIIAFLVVFGWVGLAMASGDIALYITLPVAIVCGLCMMLFIAVLIRAVMKLRGDGNVDNRNAVGVSGVVHLTVPALRTGTGKVHLMLQGSYVERDAVTDEEVSLPTGSEIVVVGVSGQTTLIVRKK